MAIGEGGDPFGRVKAATEAGGNAHAVRPMADGEPILPVPADAPPPPGRHPGKGEWSASWAYRNASGAIIGHVVRIDGPDGKQVLPLTLWREGGGLKWKWKAFTDPRPLYGLDRLARMPSAPVLVVEGEKTADAAEERFPGFAVVSWPGGSKAVAKADWSALAGREVVIFPDADAPGRKAGDDVARIASAAGAESVAVVPVPAFLPTGWDLADDWPVGFGPTEAQAAIEDARFAGIAGGVELPYGFKLDAEGLWFEQVTGKKGEKSTFKVSAPFEPLGEARDPDGSGWGVVIRFRDPDGREKTEVVSRSALVSDGAGVKARLASEGLMIVPGRGQYDRFTACLAELRCTRRITLMNATGWAPGDRFVLPARVVGPPGAEQVLFTGDAGALHYRAAGTFDGWREGVAALAPGNPLLLLALSIGFAGPLLRPLGVEGGGFHFRGGSSAGKSTVGLAAGSIWGGSSGDMGFAQSWRATANALEMIAFAHSETLLVLDELALITPEEAGQAAYTLAGGQGKARARTDGQLRKRSEWKAIFMSTGEISLAAHISSGRRGERAMTGQELRLLDISIDDAPGFGIWEMATSKEDGARRSDALKAGSRTHYGHAGPAFLEQFVHDIDDAKRIAGEVMAGFMEKARQSGDHGQVHRAALRFALVAAAGELAAAFGVVPWAGGEAAEAILGLFNRWADAFGRDAPREERDVLRTLKGAIEQQLSRFANLAEDRGAEWEEPASDRAGEARSLTTLGMRHVSGPDTYYLFHDAGWGEVFRGFDLRFAAQTLIDAGFLERGDGKHLKKQKKVQGQTRRYYWIKASILEWDPD